MPETVRKTVLENGLIVLSEYLPAVRSVSAGVWVKAGSRYEQAPENGVAHFLEHLVFKGTRKRSALQLAGALEELGASLNAYTSKELTVFHTHSLSSHLAISINVLADLVCNPLLRQSDLEKERMVILEEIGSVKDTPEEYIFDLFQEKLFPDQALGRPILGNEQSVSALTAETVQKFWQSRYCPQNMLLSVAGNIRHEQVLRLARRSFRFFGNCSDLPAKERNPQASHRLRLDIDEPLNQSHLCIGSEGVSYLSEWRYPLLALNQYLGGGMSSRLFQIIRGKYGLAYSVYSELDFFKDTGTFSIYMGTNPQRQRQALDLLYSELERVLKQPLKKTQVKKLKEQLKGSFLLGLEGSYRRMVRLAKNEMYYGRQIGLDEVLEKIQSINSDLLLEMAQKIFIIDQFNIIRLNPHA